MNFSEWMSKRDELEERFWKAMKKFAHLEATDEIDLTYWYGQFKDVLNRKYSMSIRTRQSKK